MKVFSILQHLAACALLLCACAPTAAEPLPAATPTAAPSPSATIQWFPATASPTVRPQITPSPTPDYLTGVGELLLEEPFDSGAAWSASTQPRASLIFNRSRLTLAVPQGLYLSSLRAEPRLRDFYAEVTAQVNLCRERDEYGLLFRAQDPGSAYRLTLNCAGQARLDRLRSSELSYLVTFQPSGDAPPGAPGQVRIGVWMYGNEMRVFLNGRYQFSARDPSFLEGQLGLFARAVSSATVNIAFSDLVVRMVDPSSVPAGKP